MVVRFGYGLVLKSVGYVRCLQLTLEVLKPDVYWCQSTFYDIDPKLIFT